MKIYGINKEVELRERKRREKGRGGKKKKKRGERYAVFV